MPAVCVLEQSRTTSKNVLRLSSLKARARMLLRRFYYKDVPGAPWLLQAALDTISHRDVAA
eukprot:7346252-Prorocentrum_lima.AAC.1